MPQSIYDQLSPSEVEVADFLRVIHLWWDYERPIYLTDDKERPRLWVPDFYIPEYGVYVEAVGDSRLSDYEWRKRIYRKNKIPIIFVYPFENPNWQQQFLTDFHSIHIERTRQLQYVCFPSK